MQIVDLRQVHSKTLDVLFQEEARHWRDELHWDYRPSIDLIRKFIDSRSLNGFLALDNGRPAGYGFYVLEDHKGLIGGLFVSFMSGNSTRMGVSLAEGHWQAAAEAGRNARAGLGYDAVELARVHPAVILFLGRS